MDANFDWSQARRILCVRLDALGDVLMTVPALRALRGNSNRHLTLLTSPAGRAAAELVPEVDEVLTYEAPWMKATPAHPRPAVQAEAALLERLREGKYDAAVIFTVFSQNPAPAALLCYLAGIPLRLAHCRENIYQLLTHRVPETEPDRGIRHEVRRQLDLVESVGFRTADPRMRVRVEDSARLQVRQRLRSLGVRDTTDLVVLHPGSTAPSRRYPPERFGEVARLLSADPRLTVLLAGGESERDLVEEVARAAGVPLPALVGGMSLQDFAALLEFSAVLIANNSGPVHVAASVGTPVVDLYALTNPQHTPWMVPCRVLNHDVPCKSCFKSICPQGHHLCLLGVPAERVARATRELMQEVLGTPYLSRDRRRNSQCHTWSTS